MAPKTNLERQRSRRKHEKAWLKAHGFTSWESLHTQLMNGDIWLDRVTPAYSNPNSLTNQLIDKLEPEVYRIAKAISKSKKGKQS